MPLSPLPSVPPPSVPLLSPAPPSSPLPLPLAPWQSQSQSLPLAPSQLQLQSLPLVPSQSLPSPQPSSPQPLLTSIPLAALLIADGRFPGGGHAHSGGLEAAVADASVDGAGLFPSFEAFLAGRLATAGAIDAWLAAAACRGGDPEVLDAEADARCPSPALRLASRRLGRGLRRAATASFPEIAAGPGEHHPVVLGVVARAAGLAPGDAARLAVHHLVAGAVSAAVRLLPIDAADAMAVAMRLTPVAEQVAAEGCDASAGALADGPAWSAPLVELRAERHARWEVRLFAS